MKKKLAAWIALGVITIGAGLSLSMTNEVTKDVIATQAAEAKVQARKDVLPQAEAFDPVDLAELAPLSELFVGTKNGEAVGYVGTIDVKGYGGPVQVIAGVDPTGKVTGVSVGGAAFAETAGLGAKAKDPAFAAQFPGKQAPLKAVKKASDRGDNTVDAITAATITTNAVTGGVNHIANKVDGFLNPATDEVAEGTTYTASATGFAGPVTVFVTVKDDGTIAGLKVGDDQFAETEGFGAGALEASFTRQFTGKTLPLTIDDIDAIAGATITSKAVVEAINKAYEDKNVVAQAVPEGTAYTTVEKGFAGPVAVFFTAKEDGTITSVRIGDGQFSETDGFGAAALEPAFAKQFVGKQIPLTLEQIDSISGATVTSTAVVTAINRAFEEKLLDESAATPAETPATPVATAAAATEAPVEETKAPEVAPPAAVAAVANLKSLRSRTVLGEGKGFAGPVRVALGIADDNTIASLAVLMQGFEETPAIGGKVADAAHLENLLGKALPLEDTEADVVAGATISSKALIEAINQGYARLPVPAVETAAPQEEPTPAPSQASVATETAAPSETPAPVPTEAPVTSPAPVETPTAAPTPVAALAMRAALGEAEGFAGPVRVVLSVTAENTIAALKVLDEGFEETPALGGKVAQEEYLAMFLGRALPLDETEADIISGATVSSRALIEAINQAAQRLAK